MKAEAETAEREISCAEAKYKEKADIVRLADQDWEKYELEARAKKNENAARRLV